jgi:integrase
VEPIVLPYLEKCKSKGRMYFRYRRDGHRLKLPSDSSSTEFMEKYRQIHESFENPRAEFAIAPGSVRALINAFRSSAEYKELRPTAQEMYMFYFGVIDEKVGTFPAQHLKSRHVLEWQDVLAKTPAKANNVTAAICRLYGFGKRRGLVDHNPASGIKKLKVGEWRAWTPEEISTFNKFASDSIRVAFHLALYTGQRISDIVKMQWNQIVDGGIQVTQQKTGAQIWVPIHAELQKTLDQARNENLNCPVILTSRAGTAYKTDHLKHEFKRTTREAGLPEACVFHGLRKTTAVLLAEAGCTTEQIKAVTGHRTDQMVAHYTRQASQKILARAAMNKFEAQTAHQLMGTSDQDKAS